MCDRYTKIVLTVIAACLVWICLRDVPMLADARAQSARERERREAEQQRVENTRQSDKDKIEEATPVKIVAIDETLFRTWPKSRNLYTPVPSFVQGGNVNIQGHVDATPY